MADNTISPVQKSIAGDAVCCLCSMVSLVVLTIACTAQVDNGFFVGRAGRIFCPDSGNTHMRGLLLFCQDMKIESAENP